MITRRPTDLSTGLRVQAGTGVGAGRVPQVNKFERIYVWSHWDPLSEQTDTHTHTQKCKYYLPVN